MIKLRKRHAASEPGRRGRGSRRLILLMHRMRQHGTALWWITVGLVRTECRSGFEINAVSKSDRSISRRRGRDSSTAIPCSTWLRSVRQDQYNYYPSSNPFADLSPGLQSESIAQSRRLTNAGVRGDLSYVKGIHNIKAGVTYEQTFLTENDSLGIVDPTFLGSMNGHEWLSVP